MTLIQKPNLPLVVAILGFSLSKIPIALVHHVGQVVFTLALTYWSFLEIKSGVNWFRKLLGVTVLIGILYNLVN